MKTKCPHLHHSTSIVQAKHAVSVKKAISFGSSKTNDQSIVWLEMNNDSQISHLRQILLSPASPELTPAPLSQDNISSLDTGEDTSISKVAIKKNYAASKSLATIEGLNVPGATTKKEYVTYKSLSYMQQALGWLQGSVKSEKLSILSTFVKDSINSSILENDFDYSGEVLNMIILLDTGGQPEYIHLLPTVNVHPMVTFVVHDLTKSLEGEVLVEYSEEGKSVFKPYHLKYSNLNMIKFLMSSINDSLERRSSQVPQLVKKFGSDNKSYICCIGTHADEVNLDVIQNVDSKLTSMVENLDSKAAIWQNKNEGVVFPVDNTTAGQDAKEDPVASFMRNEIDKVALGKDIYELPITWMLLELEIRQVCSNTGRAYIPFEECYSISQQCNLITDKEEIKNALIYHHLLGVLLYYPEVPRLGDFVIVDHQWLFDRISNIVYLTFKQPHDLHATKQLKYNGILSNEIIRNLKFEEGLKEEHLIALLVEMNIVAPIKREDGNGEDYFIPYVLPTYDNQSQCDKILSQYGFLQGEPFLIQFKSNLLPRGFFCCLAVEMLQQFRKGWGPLFTQKDTYHTYSNLITFRLQRAYCLSLIDKLSYLEVQIRHHENDYYFNVPIHSTVFDILSKGLENVCERLSYKRGRLQYGFHCQCKDDDDKHIALLSSMTPPFDYALCGHGCVTPTKLEKRHTVWLTEVCQFVLCSHICNRLCIVASYNNYIGSYVCIPSRDVAIVVTYDMS